MPSKRLNADLCAQLFVLGLLPILWLPREGLIYALWICVSVALCSIIRRNGWGVLLGVLLAMSYLQVVQIAKNAENLSARKGEYRLEIVRLLKQEDYQTAVGKLNSGEQFYLNWQSATPLSLGTHYRVQLNPRPISGRQNIGNFNRQKWYFANHINGLSTVKHAELLPNKNPAWRTQWLEKVKNQTSDLPNQGLLLALAFGERAWLKNADWQLFQRTTTAHLIAISGLHIALAFALGFWLTKRMLWLAMHFKPLQAVQFPLFFAKCAGVLFALGYSYLAGFAIPTQRALIAIAFLFALQYARRHYSPWQLWWRVVALLLLLDPMALLSDSFWLSILAVASLLIWYRHFPLSRFCKFSSKITRLFAALIHLQLGILLIFTPVQFFFFEGSSPWAFVANLLIVPFYSFVLVPLILFSLLTHNLLNSWQLSDWLAQQSFRLLKPLATSWLELSQFWQWQIISFNLLILLLLYYWLNRQPKLPYLLLSVTVFNGLFYLHLWHRPSAQWLMFDVGQGLAMALVEGEQAIVFDTGSSWNSSNGSENAMARLEMLPYSARHGLEVKALFLSHDDNDHSGGVADLLAKYPNAQFISAGKKAYVGKSPESCEAGKSWQFGLFKLSALHPKNVVERAQNADSCVLLVEIYGNKILLTGDLTAKQESAVAALAGKVDFLQVPHHGSKTSTSEALLRQTSPHTAFISVGRFNPWKMPNEAVLKRLEKQNILQMNTATSGMIAVDFYPDHWRIHSARNAWSAWYEGNFELQAEAGRKR